MTFLRAVLILVSTVILTYSTVNVGAKDNRAPSKIIAIGDMHGDYDAYISILQDAGLVDLKGKWSGGDTVFVQTGDIPDRGPDTLKIITHLQKIQKQARRKGGQVVTMIGNHEAMNITRDLRYVHPGEYAAFKTRQSETVREKTYAANQTALEAFFRTDNPDLTADRIKADWYEQTPLGKLEHQTAWAPSGAVGKWVVKNPVVTLIGDTIFLHGGISQKYSALSFDEMNDRARLALETKDTDPESIINDEKGPLWYRGLIQAATSPLNETPVEEAVGQPSAEGLTPAQETALILKTYGAKRIVVGHTPSTAGIKARHNGQLIQIDTGASAHYGGTRSFLRIEDGYIYAHDNGQIRRLEDGQFGSPTP